MAAVMTIGRVLVVNAGSSSLKLSVLDESDSIVDKHEIDHWDDGDASVLHSVAGDWSFDAVGHRVVHGADMTDPVVVDDAVRSQIEALTSLAPLHQPRALAGIDAARKAFGDVPSVACFDTAFHGTLPAAASTYAVPAVWRERWPLRRFGFHGLSHAYAAQRTADLLDRPLSSLRIVTCHLGAGASLCAVAGGRSVDTTMGFTPLEGLVMATRSGTVDPGMVLWLLREGGLSADEVNEGLEHESGVKALAGSADQAEVLSRAEAGDEEASAAIDVYVHRLVREMGAMVASLGGVDAITFTGGVGENAASIRIRAIAGLGFTGARVSASDNEAPELDALVHAPESSVAVAVVEAREDVEIARLVRQVVGRP
ncbi:acetate/propionate family kinase [Knoellia sp. p5-6-4]|uniref:acetate/propionate family kinase n=1 Tax=unclassified Knoellia TaxID=2618719 RepID=UPI0023DB148E|nr:acetate/propionate family kinase [Knoellia sp. p5-6-4]MDF2143789.1 acetate/propionate family kinase [Knoellia sp. p5-6-4]